MFDCALILEGGGMRGVYTAGILDYFLEQGLEFSSVYGVSAGALNGANFVSRQHGRSIRTFTEYLDDERYSGAKYLFKNGDWFNIDFVYGEIPNKLDVVDWDTFAASTTKFYAVLSNVVTGKAEYHHVTDLRKQMDTVRRSASLPLLSTIVNINGKKYLDGGICDSIPLYKSIQDGNHKNVVILTQHRGFEKQPASAMGLVKLRYRKYPKFVRANRYRHLMYNNQTKYVYQKEKEGQAFVIQPKEPVNIDRLEKNTEKLWRLYRAGYNDGKESFERMMKYLDD